MVFIQSYKLENIEMKSTKEIEKILETLWAIRNDDKFYFKAYGEQMINELINKQRESK